MPGTNSEFMATYKKRGYKPKTKVEKVEEVEEHSTTAEVFNTLDESASKTEEWVIANQKNIFILVALVAVVVLGYLGYNKFVAEPQNELAMNDMYKAQSYFEQALAGVESDSLYALSLNGGEGKYGMLDIIENYSGTDAANLASYYAGMAYLNTKDYKNAIEYLSDFSSEDKMLAPIAKGAIGDAFVQLDQASDALSYYEKAIALSTNGYTTPLYLLKAGELALNSGDASKALKYFNRIKTEFSASTEATNIETFIGKAEASM